MFDEYEHDCTNFVEVMPIRVQVALEVIKTAHNNQVTYAAFDVIHDFLKKEV